MGGIAVLLCQPGAESLILGYSEIFYFAGLSDLRQFTFGFYSLIGLKNVQKHHQYVHMYNGKYYIIM